MKIAMISAEVFPYAKTGGLADVVGALPRALAARGHEVLVFFPRYRTVDVRKNVLTPESRKLPIAIGAEVHEVSFLRGAMGAEGAQAIAIDIPALYDREGLYGPPGADFPDNAERFIALARASLEYLRVGEFTPAVVHAHDWHAGLVPIFLRQSYLHEPVLMDSASVFTVHNMAYQGTFESNVLRLAELPSELFRPGGLDHFGKLSFLQAGLRYGDTITTVSPRYAQEVMESDEFGRGMQGILRERMPDFFGLLNGIDTGVWNPADDPCLPAPYSSENRSGKGAARAALQRELELDVDSSPLLGCVSRLDPQKGLDLIQIAMPTILAKGCQIALLGAGDPGLEAFFRNAAKSHRGRVGVGVGYNDPLAHRIYGGADLFLMPSRFEPCGLGQMIAMRYGTIPIVRETGGLADTVRDADRAADGNGFSFQKATPEVLLDAVRRALVARKDPARWTGLVSRAMNEDHSWSAAAARYEELYDWTIKSTHRARKKRRTS